MTLYAQTPQDLGRVLDNGFGLYRSGLKAVLPISFVAATIVNLPNIVAGFLPQSVQGLLLLVALIFYAAAYVGMIYTQDATARGAAPVSVNQAMGRGFSRMGAIILTGFLAMLAVVGGMILLLVPGLILMVTLGFCPYIVALENLGAVDSIKRSHNLVWGHFWRTAVVMTVAIVLYAIPVMLLTGIAGFAIGMGVGAGGDASGKTAEEAVAGFVAVIAIVQIVMAGLLGPLMSGILLAQFNDLKLRKSGADLVARAGA